MPNMNQFVQQAQALQANLQKAQAEIARLEVVGESGGGVIKVTMTGKHEVKQVQIDPSVLTEDREMLEDLIAAAINSAVQRVESASQAKMSALMGGLSLPPGMKLPF
jgi:nucleoid-associated protein EbfC